MSGPGQLLLPHLGLIAPKDRTTEEILFDWNAPGPPGFYNWLADVQPRVIDARTVKQRKWESVRRVLMAEVSDSGEDLQGRGPNAAIATKLRVITVICSVAGLDAARASGQGP